MVLQQVTFFTLRSLQPWRPVDLKILMLTGGEKSILWALGYILVGNARKYVNLIRAYF